MSEAIARRVMSSMKLRRLRQYSAFHSGSSPCGSERARDMGRQIAVDVGDRGGDQPRLLGHQPVEHRPDMGVGEVAEAGLVLDRVGARHRRRNRCRTPPPRRPRRGRSPASIDRAGSRGSAFWANSMNGVSSIRTPDEASRSSISLESSSSLVSRSWVSLSWPPLSRASAAKVERPLFTLSTLAWIMAGRLGDAVGLAVDQGDDVGDVADRLVDPGEASPARPGSSRRRP